MIKKVEPKKKKVAKVEIISEERYMEDGEDKIKVTYSDGTVMVSTL